MARLTHSEAKAVVDRALPDLTPAESLALRGVAVLESNYGAGWKPPGTGSHNWGAITMRPQTDGTCGPGGFSYGDSRYDPETGKVIKYTTCFRRYASHEEGAAHLARVMLKPNVKAAAAAGDLHGVSAAMRENRYYLGTVPKPQAIDAHHQRLRAAIDSIVAQTGEADPFADAGQEPAPDSVSDLLSLSREPSDCSCADVSALDNPGKPAPEKDEL